MVSLFEWKRLKFRNAIFSLLIATVQIKTYQITALLWLLLYYLWINFSISTFIYLLSQTQYIINSINKHRIILSRKQIGHFHLVPCRKGFSDLASYNKQFARENLFSLNIFKIDSTPCSWQLLTLLGNGKSNWKIVMENHM